MSEAASVDLIVRGNVGEVTLNRPSKHNALTPAMYRQIAARCAEINAADTIHVAIFCGGGTRAFCAGSDVGALGEYDDFWAWRNRADYIAPILALRKPAVAAIKGWALGGGLEIALACDLRVAARSAVFAAPEVALGWSGGGGAAYHLARLCGYGRAMKYLLSGERFSAETAEQMGMIEWLVDDGDELARAREVAAVIAAHSSVATQAVKAAVRRGMDLSVGQGLQNENELMALCFARRARQKSGSDGDA